MKDRKAENRVAAVRKLREFPIVDAANVILLQGCASPHADVQRESFQTLAAISAGPAVRAHLQGELARDAKRGGSEFRSAAIACVLLCSEEAEAQAGVKPWLEQEVKEKRGPAVLVAMVDELGALGDAASLRALAQLGQLPLFQKQFGPRRAWIQALIQVRLPAAVTLLIEPLPRLQGETRVGLLRHLTSLRGQRLEGDDQWLAWWKEQKDAFKFPAAGGAAAAALTAKQGEASYYGLPLYGTKIVFILDTSGSMSGPRIIAAQRE